MGLASNQLVTPWQNLSNDRRVLVRVNLDIVIGCRLMVTTLIDAQPVLAILINGPGLTAMVAKDSCTHGANHSL
jgi:hypothetical protein